MSRLPNHGLVLFNLGGDGEYWIADYKFKGFHVIEEPGYDEYWWPEIWRRGW